MPLGLHFEGPFVSPERCGALHAEDLLDARPENLPGFFDAVAGAPGRGMVTLAPEVQGGIDLVRELSRRGFVVSIGHTSASPETLDAAFAAGARHMTHFANAMTPLHHRAVGPIGWGLLREGVTLDVIGDLQHMAPEMLHLVFQAKRAGHVALISDAIPPAGMNAAGSSEWKVWGETLFVDQHVARNRKGALAGSLALLDEMERNLLAIGIGAEAAASSVREAPRRVLGL
jgi:N-acetylglucosamine-6-phosphate deacetylase